MYSTTYVGLDVHKETISIAVAHNDKDDVHSLGIIPNEPYSIKKMTERLQKSGRQLIFCYEAGPCGYGLYRQLTNMGFGCIVVAPSLIPQKPGQRVKTDRKDAEGLARWLRSGELTPVWVPDEEHEAFRDLVRARQTAKEDVHRQRQRIRKMLLRLGLSCPHRAWSSKYNVWLRQLKLDNHAQDVVLREFIHALDECEQRMKRLENEAINYSKTSSQKHIIEALQALRGVAFITAATIVAEVGDITRFQSASQFMSYAGLVPTEHSSGNRQSRGRITKCGNSNLRFVAIESAWHYRHRPAVGVALKKRQEGVSEEIKQISWKAQHRLNQKYRRMMAKGKQSGVAITAVAREFLGFVWAIAQSVQMGSQQAA